LKADTQDAVADGCLMEDVLRSPQISHVVLSRQQIS
jgi:hypothetical protein